MTAISIAHSASSANSNFTLASNHVDTVRYDRPGGALGESVLGDVVKPNYFRLSRRDDDEGPSPTKPQW